MLRKPQGHASVGTLIHCVLGPYASRPRQHSWTASSCRRRGGLGSDCRSDSVCSADERHQTSGPFRSRAHVPARARVHAPEHERDRDDEDEGRGGDGQSEYSSPSGHDEYDHADGRTQSALSYGSCRLDDKDSGSRSSPRCDIDASGCSGPSESFAQGNDQPRYTSCPDHHHHQTEGL